MSTPAIRVRFAPSPTGMFHVGSARSALFNWAVAKQSEGGVFVLRIEDTDAARNQPEWIEGITTALSRIGIDGSDPAFEGPIFQSANAERHAQAALQLFEAGAAYYCDCTRDDVKARREAAGTDPNLGYDEHCRERGLAWEPGRALRFRTPQEGETVVLDVIRGEPTFPNASLEDFVVARGDRSAVFLLANVVDDLDEGITMVIRGEEHLSNTPKQQLLWQALGAVPPRWAHLPVIVNEKRQKLSKRRDKVAMEDYLAEGFLVDALVNYLMLLGWNPGDDVEIRPPAQLLELFRIEDVTLAPAFFDIKKLTAFNAEYIRALPPEEFVAAARPFLQQGSWAPDAFDEKVFIGLAPLIQTRVQTLAEIPAAVEFLFLDEPPQDDASWTKAMKDNAPDLLRATRDAFAAAPDWSADALKAALEQVAEAAGLKLGKAQAPIRVATTGRTVGLPLFESLEALGRERTLARIDAALARLAGSTGS
jgi:glutamyl-tRNA synthetase